MAHQQSQGCHIPKYASRRALSGGIQQPWLRAISEERGGFEVFRTSNTRFGPGCEQLRCVVRTLSVPDRVQLAKLQPPCTLCVLGSGHTGAKLRPPCTLCVPGSGQVVRLSGFQKKNK